MTWEYALIGLIIGFIIGALAVRFGSTKLRQQNAVQAELEKNRAELEEYRKELVSHFARSAELLDNMARDYRQLYQHMAKSSNELMPNMPVQDNPFNYRLNESKTDSNQIVTDTPPRDYSEGASGLFRPIQDQKQ
ncbi:Z-ring associated protein ZapG [Xenorhabdus siamensis]|uniref:Z-ring associated protein ZapG n=1 Tax=Xenorhabdus siamensis TaxID=3136254 RepID=UPI0030F45270